MRMIRSRPWIGYGIGAFYLTSVQFASPGGLESPQPNFAHDAMLQLAAELGLPFALLFLVLAAWILLLVMRQAPAGDPAEHGGRIGSFCLATALIAYGATQLTANSLNIYVSHQFFFWCLMALSVIALPVKAAGAGLPGPIPSEPPPRPRPQRPTSPSRPIGRVCGASRRVWVRARPALITWASGAG